MKASFDIAAKNYDQSFTYTAIGKLQRNLVYNTLSKHLKNVQNILEINCGTGEDAFWLSQQNFKVLATDISEEMVAIAKAKNHSDYLTFEILDINAIAEKEFETSFDFIFSNFGGLNCLTKIELEKFFINANEILSKKGKLAVVIMPKNTLWERLYFIFKGKFQTAYRRTKKTAMANVDGINVPTYYYNPKDIVNLTYTNFEFIASKPVGFFVPPSYLEPFFKNKKGLLKFLNYLENKTKNWSFLSKYADHYILILQKR